MEPPLTPGHLRPDVPPSSPSRLVIVSLRSLLAAVFALNLGLCVSMTGGRLCAAERHDFFEKKIRPVLIEHCYECHSADSDEIGGKLRVDTREAMLTGGESGPVLQAGRPDDSLIIQALRYDGMEMPPDGPLPEAVINDFVKWVSLGAADPRRAATTGADDDSQSFSVTADRESLWSFVPRQDPPLPAVNAIEWCRDPIDRFVLAGIEQAGLRPAPDADPRTLLRRLFHDLIGLAPTQEQIEAFAAEFDQDGEFATSRWVDRLLDSPQFGVRWGRHWLDVARYGESNGDDGLGRNATFPNAWRYRDYVIDALNCDVPYDRFLTEQIAGDLLPAATAEQRNRQLIATGFLAIGSKPASAMNKNFAMDVVDDQINAVCTTVLGLSVACARCHDHKHDPIPTRDYYALAGIFRSTETLYGAAGNEKLTAPPTPLHELRSDQDGAVERPDRRSAPTFPAEYSDSIDALKPSLHAKLDARVDGLSIPQDVSFSADEFAAVKESRLIGKFASPADSYSLSFWFRNSVENDARPITAYLFSRAKMDDKTLPGDHLGIGGNHDKSKTGKLFVFNGNAKKVSIAGTTVIDRNSWNHVVLVRDQKRIKVFLNGRPEIQSDLEATFEDSVDFCLAARSDNFAPLSGNLGEVALFDRALTDREAMRLHETSEQPRGIRPSPPLGFAMGVREAAKPDDCKIHINGDGAKLGPIVPRGVLTAYSAVVNPASAIDSVEIQAGVSGRAALAAWLVRPDHPQTARVMANRIWMHLFDRGIVTTPDDFGVYGARPSHPELLDHLAGRFIRGRWSIKQLIRSIVLSRTYGQSSNADPVMIQRDGDNVWFARHQRKRLDAETLRDRILQASGQIDFSPGQGSAIEELDQLINWPPGESTDLHRPSNHRSVYLCMLRHAAPKELAAFDLPDGVAVSGRRDVTTQPTQSLFLMNGDFVVDQSRELARRILEHPVANPQPQGDRERVTRVFSDVLQRKPDGAEIQQSLEYLRSAEAILSKRDQDPNQSRLEIWASLAQALMTTNEFRYVD